MSRHKKRYRDDDVEIRYRDKSDDYDDYRRSRSERREDHRERKKDIRDERQKKEIYEERVPRHRENSESNERQNKEIYEDRVPRHRENSDSNNERQKKEMYEERVPRHRENSDSNNDRQKRDIYEERVPKQRENPVINERMKADASSNADKGKLETDEPLSRKSKMDSINLRTGGAYIPPAKLKLMQEKITDKGSAEYQRIAWEALKKSITGLTNKVNITNITDVVRELFKENIIRGRGVLTRAIMQAQAASPTFTHVYAALVTIMNTKFPEISELLLKRLIIQFKRGFRRNDKQACVSSTRFIAHLLNQEVAHEVVVLEILTLLLETPTEDSVEVAIALLKECGCKLTELSNKGMIAIFERLRHVLQEGKLDKRVQYMIEVMYAIRKDKFKDFQPILEGLDLVEDDDKCTHLISLDEAVDFQEILNVFKFDPDYIENEEKYKSIVKEILGDDSGSEESDGSGGDSDSEEEEDEKTNENQQIIDMTETNLVSLRRNIYLTIQSSLDFEECAHKLLKLELKPGQIVEMCYMILDCCAQQRTYEKFYGLLAQRFCHLNKVYVEPFTEIFKNSYETIHRLETNKLRNVAKFFAHLLYTDAIAWLVLSNIKLNEEDTTSSSRIFIKILFQELCEYMGLTKLNERVKDVTLQEAFEGLFPRDNPHNARFAINFFTSIGLGGLTDELREHLKNMPKNPIVPQVPSPVNDSPVSEDSSVDSATGSSSSSSESEESDDSAERRKKKRKAKKSKTSKNKYRESESDSGYPTPSKKQKRSKKKNKLKKRRKD